MYFDPENKVIRLCAAGMEKESAENQEEALALFMQGWEEAENDFEKFIAAHYVARRQGTIEEKLIWDELSLQHALKIPGQEMKQNLPSLYLNLAKGLEDLGYAEQAAENYRLAHNYSEFLPNDGYGQMIQSGIEKGMERIKNKLTIQHGD